MRDQPSKQRMISPADLLSPAYLAVPDAAKPTALGLWLTLDAFGRGPMDPEWIASRVYPDRPTEQATATVFEHLVLMLGTFLVTYVAEEEEWIQLLHPLKADLRRARPAAPEPPEAFSIEPQERPRMSMALGGGRGRASASGHERARERARAQVRAEDAARADAWAALQQDREAERPMDAPERPFLLDAPPAFCPDHMPSGAGKQGCGPCRDHRVVREEWIQRKAYESKLAAYHEQQDQQGAEYVQPDADRTAW